MSKRTYEQSLTFFKRNTNNRGEGRELYKTPVHLIKQIVESLLMARPDLVKKVWVDPCAGDGRWGKVIKSYGIKCLSYDIEPLTEDVIKGDFMTLSVPDKSFIIGNPPFSKLKEFINRALVLTNECYFLGGSQVIAGTLSNKVSLLHRFEGYEGNQRDKRSKVKFVDTLGKEVLVWCCGALFDGFNHTKFRYSDELVKGSFRTSVKRYCIEDTRVISLKK